MALTKQEIIDYALRYISEKEISDFPFSGELFCFLSREIIQNKILKDDEGWIFTGYGVCDKYEIDETEKPEGKWILFSFNALNTFPPTYTVLKLQPPHIAKGFFNNGTRTQEVKIAKIPLYNFNDLQEKPTIKKRENSGVSNIIQFPQKKKNSK